MVQGDGLVQVNEIDAILNLSPGACYRMHRKGIFYAVKLRNNLWAVREQDMAEVITRILRYRARQPWYPLENMTIEAASDATGLTVSSIYALGYRHEIDWAANEHWKFPTKESINRICRRRGLKEVA